MAIPFYIWNVTETTIDELFSSVNPFDHKLKVFTFTSQERAEEYLDFLQRRHSSNVDEDNDMKKSVEFQTVWCIQRHILNPDASCVLTQHYDLETLKEQNPSADL